MARHKKKTDIITTYSFRVSNNDICEFRLKSQHGCKLPKTAPADIMRAFVKAYNKTPKVFYNLLKDYLT